MLALSRKESQWVRIIHRSGDELWIRVYHIQDNGLGRSVRLAFDDAPHNFAITRPKAVDWPADGLSTTAPLGGAMPDRGA
jgi:sRNA-binding carbon storage regulator CsrA